MKNFLLIAGIITTLAALALLVLFVFGLVNAFQNSEGNSNPVLLSIIFLGPPLLVTGFAAWACWTFYADQPGKKDLLPLGKNRAVPNLWTSISGKPPAPKPDADKQDHNTAPPQE